MISVFDVLSNKMKGSVQHCIKSEIDVLGKEALNAFKFVINLRKKWRKEIVTIALVLHHFE